MKLSKISSLGLYSVVQFSKSQNATLVFPDAYILKFTVPNQSLL